MPISSEMSDLQAAVAAERTVVSSVVTYVQGLADQILAAAGDKAAATALAAEVRDQADDLAAAIVQNTPQA